MARVSTLYRPGYGPDDHDDENAFGVPPDGVVLGHDYGSPGNDRELDEYVSRQAGRSPDLKSVTTPDALAAGEPNDAEPDADSDDLKAYIERNAADKANKPVAYNPDQAHDSETWAMADAAPQAQAPIDTSPSTLTKGAIIASGIGSFLQRKPFDQQFWGGREAHREKLARQGLVDQQAADRAALARQTLGLRGQELAQHAEGLKARIADNGEQREVQRARLGLEGDRTAATRTLSDAKAADLNRKGALATENADANGDRAHRMTEFYVRNGIPLRSVQGLSPDDMKQLSPELEKAFNLAEPQVRAEVGLAGRKAGAESDARLPNELTLAQVRANNAEDLAKTRAAAVGGGGQDMDVLMRQAQEAYPFAHIARPEQWKATRANRTMLARSDEGMINAGLLNTAGRDVIDAYRTFGDSHNANEKAFNAGKFHTAVLKAVGAAATLSGDGSIEGRNRALEEYPTLKTALFTPTEDLSIEMVRGMQEELDHATQRKIAGYGWDLGPATAQPTTGEQPITRSVLGDEIPTTDPQDRLPVTPRIGPKVNKVTGTDKPAPSIGKRNGKDVRAIKSAKKDGKPVRVVFYIDGTTEVVQ